MLDWNLKTITRKDHIIILYVKGHVLCTGHNIVPPRGFVKITRCEFFHLKTFCSESTHFRGKQYAFLPDICSGTGKENVDLEMAINQTARSPRENIQSG